MRSPGAVGGSAAGSGDGAMSLVGAVSVLSMRWMGGQATVGAAGQPPAALVDRPMMGPAQQGQVGQVGGAAVEPVDQVVALAPAQGPSAVGEDTAAVADREGGALGEGDDPAGPAQVQGLAGGAAQDRGQHGQGGPEPLGQAWLTAGVAGRGGPLGTLAGPGVASGGGLAGDQHPGEGAVTGQPPTRRRGQGFGPAGLAAHRPGTAEEAVQVDHHTELGPDPAALGELAGLQGAAGQLDQGVGPALVAAAGVVGVTGAGQGSRAASRVWPASGSSSPCRATMPSQVGASHSPRRPWRRSAWWSAPSGSVTCCRWPRARRSRGGSSRRAAASSSTGSACLATWVGSSLVPWASTAAWATESSRRTAPGRSWSGAAEQRAG